MTERPPKAYKVSDDEMATIVWDHHRISAHKRGANFLGQDSDEFLQWSFCHRAPEFDEYHDKPLPVWVLVAYGWWFECTQCGARLEEDRMHDEGKDPSKIEGTLHSNAYCDSGCKEAYDRWQHKHKQWRATFLDDMKAKLEKQCPRWGEIQYQERAHHFYAREGAEHVVQASLAFRVPKAKFEWQFKYEYKEDEEEQPHLYEFSIPRGDLELFQEWYGKGISFPDE